MHYLSISDSSYAKEPHQKVKAIHKNIPKESALNKEDKKRVSDNFSHMAGSKSGSDKSRFSSATRVRKIGSAQDSPLDSLLILTLYSKSILNTVSQSFLKTFTTEDLVIKSSNITLLILFFLLIIFLFDNVLTL